MDPPKHECVEYGTRAEILVQANGALELNNPFVGFGAGAFPAMGMVFSRTPAGATVFISAHGLPAADVDWNVDTTFDVNVANWASEFTVFLHLEMGGRGEIETVQTGTIS